MVSNVTVAGLALGAILLSVPSALAQSDTLDRTVLPIPEPPVPVYTELDARNTKPPSRFEVKAPDGAPNVLIVLIDDMGFGQSGAFGGPIHMPTVEALANEGLRYNEFHTTALCSPTRIALLTGRNHHMNNMGGITEIATAYPGNTGQRPNSIAPLAEMLRLNGYSTAAFGKSHETAAWELSVSGPTDRWPTRSGFDKFYGFIGGETNQWHPALYEDMTPIEPPHDPNYHLMTDMTNHAIAWVRAEKSLTPDKPFFIYFAPGATHAPHHVPKEWIEKYRGKFDQGWDKLREETLARQKALGVVPQDTVLAPKPKDIRDWDSLSDDEKKLFARQMEVFAGFGEYADTEIGRLISAIGELGQLDNTLVFYIIGDNGASAEGGMVGLFNESTYFNKVAESVPEILKHLDDLGGPNTYPHYAAGWAVAGDTPFTWTKQIASSYGGTRNGLVVHWPKGIHAKNEVRSQWHHVIDVAPTVLEAAHLPEPKTVNGTPQTPIQGVSMMYSFDDAKAKDRHLTQYFEIAGNRAIYHDGWLAGTIHRAPWEYTPRHKLTEDVWELYDTRSDFSLAHDLAAANPEKLKEMQDIFLEVGGAKSCAPDRRPHRRAVRSQDRGAAGPHAGTHIAHALSGHERQRELIHQPQERLAHDHRRRRHSGRRRRGHHSGTGRPIRRLELLPQGRQADLRVQLPGSQEVQDRCRQAAAPGQGDGQFEFAYDGGGLGKGGTGRILVDGQKVAEGRIDETQCCLIALDETADVGRGTGTPVSDDYRSPFPFIGTIDRVVVNLTPGADAQSDEARKAQDEAKQKRATVQD